MRRRTLLAALPLALVLAACSGGEPAPSADVAFETASERLLEAGSVKVDVTSTGVPVDTDAIMAVKGTGILDADKPRFKGAVTGRIDGTTGAIDVIAIGDQAWMSFFTKDYNPVDLEEMGVPNPSELFTPEGGLAAVLEYPGTFTAGEPKRLDDEVLQTYTGTLPGAVVAEALNLGKGGSGFDATFGIDPESGELRQVVLTGQFFDTGTTTYTLELTDYGTAVEITQP